MLNTGESLRLEVELCVCVCVCVCMCVCVWVCVGVGVCDSPLRDACSTSPGHGNSLYVVEELNCYILGESCEGVRV